MGQPEGGGGGGGGGGCSGRYDVSAAVRGKLSWIRRAAVGVAMMSAGDRCVCGGGGGLGEGDGDH